MKMVTEGLIPTTLVKNLSALPTPCNDVVYYPTHLTVLGTQEKYSVFQAFSRKSGLAYIAITHPDTTKFIFAGSRSSMYELYQVIPWPEYKISNGELTFYYKTAPSLQTLEDYFNNIKKQ
jgi:hypothetical protein